jgi:3-methyladenine DNA glycosylase/8-oxoguanine DNA glycosylase
MEILLKNTSPFSLESIIHSHGWIQLAPFHYIKGSQAFSYTTTLASGEVYTLKVCQKPSGIVVNLPDYFGREDQIEVEQTVKWMLAWDIDLSDFYALAAQESKLAHLPQKTSGRILRSASLFEDVVKTILTTNTSWSGTIRMVQAFVDHFGKSHSSQPQLRAFPSPEDIAGTNEQALRAQTRLGYRAPYILELAQNIDSGKFDLEKLKNNKIPSAELRKELLAIKGVGEYAAASLLLLLGRYEFLPIDSWALKIVSQEWYQGNPIGKKEVEAAFEKWGNWKGLVYWFWNWTDQNE